MSPAPRDAAAQPQSSREPKPVVCDSGTLGIVAIFDPSDVPSHEPRDIFRVGLQRSVRVADRCGRLHAPDCAPDNVAEAQRTDVARVEAKLGVPCWVVACHPELVIAENVALTPCRVEVANKSVAWSGHDAANNERAGGQRRRGARNNIADVDRCS
eukprot:Amastigsp_a9497_82.p2 type:complete len:156 gc:universal Amastigsp_a9497_82:58-525(+)